MIQNIYINLIKVWTFPDGISMHLTLKNLFPFQKLLFISVTAEKAKLVSSSHMKASLFQLSSGTVYRQSAIHEVL